MFGRGICLISALTLAACAGPTVEVARDAEAAVLRDCATITERCANPAALSASLPGICDTDGACWLTHRFEGGEERLATLRPDAGRVCGFRAVLTPERQFAIIGVWSVASDGTRFYETARFLSAEEIRRIDAAGDAVAACETL